MTELTPAPQGYPIKLVRDRTADIINSTGEPGGLFYDKLPQAEVGPWLKRKLGEEVVEYLLDGGVDELADVLAVVEGLVNHLHGTNLDGLVNLMRADKRGGFLTGQMMRGHHPEFDGHEDKPERTPSLVTLCEGQHPWKDESS